MFTAALEARICAFARDPGTGGFAELALELFEHHFECLPRYRDYCRSLEVSPASVKHWREIPAAPADREPSLERLQAGDQATARLAERQSLAPTLASLALRGLFAQNSTALLLPTTKEALTVSALTATTEELPEDSLVSESRLDAKRLRSWLGARQRDGRPVRAVGTLGAYLELVRLLERRQLKFRLPAGSAAFCLTPVSDRPEFPVELFERLGLTAEAWKRILLRDPYSTPLPEAAPGRFQLPGWVRSTDASGAGFGLLDLGSITLPAHRLEPRLAAIGGEPTLARLAS